MTGVAQQLTQLFAGEPDPAGDGDVTVPGEQFPDRDLPVQGDAHDGAERQTSLGAAFEVLEVPDRDVHASLPEPSHRLEHVQAAFVAQAPHVLAEHLAQGSRCRGRAIVRCCARRRVTGVGVAVVVGSGVEADGGFGHGYLVVVPCGLGHCVWPRRLGGASGLARWGRWGVL